MDGKEYRKGCRDVELKFDKTQYGDHEIAVACKCRMCTRSLGDAGAAMTIAVVHKPPVAKFEMDPKPGDRTANPWTVRLKCVSTGDVDYRIWKCDGAAIGGASNQVEVSVCAPLGRGTHRYSLEVGSDDGKKSEAAPQEINVWNFWLLLVFLAIALSVAGFFWWYFSGDDPRFWKVFGFVDETNSKGVQDVEAEMLSFTLIKEYWDTLRNRATIPLHKLGGAQSDDWGNGTTLGQTGLVLWEAKTAGDTLGVRMPNYNLMNPPEGVERDSYSNGQLIRIWAPSPSKPPSMTTLWVKIIMPGVVPNTYLWFRLGILLACLVAVAVFSWLFVF